MEGFCLVSFMEMWKKKLHAPGNGILLESGESYSLSGWDAFLDTMNGFIRSQKAEWGERYPTNEDVFRGRDRAEISGETAMEILWAWNFPFLVRLARRYPKESPEGLIVSSFENFRRAVDRYDERQGVRFLSFCRLSLEGAMKEEYFRNKTYRERQVLSLNTPVANPMDEELETIDLTADESQGTPELMEERDRRHREREQIRRLLAVVVLTERQSAVIEKVYFEDKSQADTARELGITPTSVRDALQGARRKLKRALEKEPMI